MANQNVKIAKVKLTNALRFGAFCFVLSPILFILTAHNYGWEFKRVEQDKPVQLEERVIQTPDRPFPFSQTDSPTESKYPKEWIEKIKRFENEPLYCGKIEESDVHKDRLKKTVSEVGYGITNAEIFNAKRFGIIPPCATLPQKLTKAQADEWFEKITLPTYEKVVEEVVKVPLTREQKFALISFCHNLGGKNLEKLTMADGRLDDSNYAVIAKYITLYTSAGDSKKVGGLVKRRQWEAELWKSGTKNRSTEVASK